MLWYNLCTVLFTAAIFCEGKEEPGILYLTHAVVWCYSEKMSSTNADVTFDSTSKLLINLIFLIFLCRVTVDFMIREVLVTSINVVKPFEKYYRPHRSTTYLDAAYCYRLSSVVCLLVCRSVCYGSDPCKSGWTDRDDVLIEDSGGLREPCIRWGSRSPMGRAILRGKVCPIVK